MRAPPDIAAAADRVLLEHGHFDPFECLMVLGYLGAGDYEDWRHQRRADLQSALRSDLDEVLTTLSHARAYVLGQGFGAEPHALTAWTVRANTLVVGASKELTRLCSERLIRSTAHVQADLFQDSAATVALNELRAALVQQRLDDARSALRRFLEISGDAARSAEYQLLIEIDAGRTRSGAMERLAQLRDKIAPLAYRLLGIHVHSYLAPLWTRLAHDLADAPFDPDAPDLHASYAYYRCGNWPRVIASIEADARMLAYEIPLVRLAEAYARLSRYGAARRLWSRLCWEHPQRAASVLSNAPADAMITHRWLEFGDLDADLTIEQFPAWLLIVDPQQSGSVPPELAPANHHGRTYQAVSRLVRTDGAMSARLALRELSAELLRIYLEHRSR